MEMTGIRNWSVVVDHVPGQGWEAHIEGEPDHGWEAGDAPTLLASVASVLADRQGESAGGGKAGHLTYDWDVASAISQVTHGALGADRTDSAYEWLMAFIQDCVANNASLRLAATAQMLLEKLAS